MNWTRVVAIAELGSPADAAVPLLAADLGTTAYELKLLLSAGLPAIVLLTPDEGRADAARNAVVRRGHRVVGCVRSDVVSSATTTTLKDFRFEGGSLVAASADADRLPFAEISGFVRASHRTSAETKTEVKERKLRPGMAIATGGLVSSKTVTREVVARSEDREQVLYLFRRSGGAPWILRERTARYGGLGADAGRTLLENFDTTIRRLRELAPNAFYDDRLKAGRAVRGIASAVDATDFLAHLIALDLTSR